ncbi:hypothetical protein Ocin01_18730 [Orchesella cincta]|uniref:Uncharacterized protein n=1 Tax=Orchesella cincta TaxID=48709 RepID=A0A1D2M4W1_ORCCI|nr:hypothetical protein Ocin01_18730 [Orchesella cincta]
MASLPFYVDPNIFVNCLIVAFWPCKWNQHSNKCRVNVDPREAWPWPFDDSKTSYILFEVDPSKTPDYLYYFVGISLFGQSDEEVKKLDSLRCVNPSLLSGRFVTLLPDSIPTSRPIPVFHERSFKVKLGANDESIILTSAFGNKTYGNARSVSLKAGDKTFVLQVMRELAEPEKMDIFILSRNETIQLEVLSGDLLRQS